MKRFEVSAKAVKEAKLCAKKFSCLSGGGANICPVKADVSDKIIFVKCSVDGKCQYKNPFGAGFFCTCPVRLEIYRKYKK